MPDVSKAVLAAQSLLRRRLSGMELPLKIHGYENERKTLLDIIARTAEMGESNSLLVIGPRGSGKSMLIKSVLEELSAKETVTKNLLHVHLNGLLQTDDRVALKEITRQLHLENVVENKVFGSFAENLQFLLDTFKSGGKHTKSILFLLDEFDMLAQHKNQTLLYNLFDVAQSAQAPICVLGLTTRLDVLELLEKRVKSRFSHRQVHLLLSLTFTQFVDTFCDSLTLPEKTFPFKEYAKQWNKAVKSISQEGAVLDALRRQYNLDRDFRALHAIMHVPVGRLSAKQPFLVASDFVDSAQIANLDSKAAMLHGISVLELCLVIAMKHLTELYDQEPFNFEMLYKEYQKFVLRRSSMQEFDKAVVLKAFEHLVALELVGAADGGGTRCQKEYRLMNLLVAPSQISDALTRYPACPTDIKQWGQSNLS